MGWVVLKATRSNTSTGDIIGNIAPIFPKINEQFDMGTGYKTLEQILTYPEFPIEAYIFTFPTAINMVENFGFGNAIDISKYNGETWTLENGSRMVIDYHSYSNGDQTASITFYYPNNNPAGNFIISSYDYGAGVDWLPVWYADGQEGRMDGGFFETTGSNAGTLRYSGKVPFSFSVEPYEFFRGITPLYDNDPYNSGGTSVGGGGTGDFNNDSVDIPIPPQPALSAVDAGFITLFNPTLSQLQNLASYMWSDLFDVDGWKKIFADPMGAILGLSIVPVSIPNTGLTREVKVGNISTGVNMFVADTQYITLDCGTINVKEHWGAYLDYDPYTKAEIYLPYIGTHTIATDDIMGKSVHIVYRVDILSGACCAYILCNNTVLYTFVGQCSSSIPITGDNWTNVINGVLSIAGSIGSMVATGGLSAPMAVGNIASTAVNTMKPTVEKSGSVSGTGGLLGVQTPYLIITRPRQALPANQNSFIGYPAFTTELLDDLTGYTEIESIHLENVPATDSELSEIESLLKSGVIF